MIPATYRDYQRDPYAGYEKSRYTYFAVNNEAPDNYHPKEIVVGLGIDGVYKAYPFIELDKQGKSQFSDSVNGTRFNFDWDSANRSITITDSTGPASRRHPGLLVRMVCIPPRHRSIQGPGFVKESPSGGNR